MTSADTATDLDPLLDRAAGALLATACGDALGAGYEFDAPMPDDAPVAMIGGGIGAFEPGEWTDDTAMAVAVARAAERGLDLRGPAGLDVVSAGFLEWFATEPKDVGNLTRTVLWDAGGADAAAMSAVALRRYEESPGSSGGNGGLMRTAAVALAHLGDEVATADAARAVSALTHADPNSQEASALWSCAIRHAVLHGSFDGLRLAVGALPEDRAAWWTAKLDEAEAHPPAHFTNNGWVVGALQAAWSAIVRTPVPMGDPASHLQRALEAGVRGGGDTDTVAAIAGGLLGARWGALAVPAHWRAAVHGWPGLRGPDLEAMGARAALRSLEAGPS